jgi:hypothetical protein
MTIIRGATTAQLIALNEIDYDHLNQKMDRRAYEKLDPEGIHVVTFSMGHGDHIRARFLLKETNVPIEECKAEVLIDMPVEAWNELPRWDSDTGEPLP